MGGHAEIYFIHRRTAKKVYEKIIASYLFAVIFFVVIVYVHECCRAIRYCAVGARGNY